MEKEEPDWEDHLDPMESSAGPLTDRGFPKLEPEILQIKIEKEEPDWGDHLDPMESSAGPLTDRGKFNQ
ncbi:hypothetical protein GDO86_018051 [Hymenochirus boettgeri]|uniref:Uncharacterized protein n=1 Tax=Hymenochirus boettgeri TaxID=247094 RepID=A0A8T2IIE3_9PIPI|nr:hypothetical protein GDO86_018051 [Hymenochirus boettgeri]KAG8431594.1 hypothetical protein GDO86_018051 [Hymenochirus boettgeri]